MRRLSVFGALAPTALLLLAACGDPEPVEVTSAGGSYAAPLLRSWAAQFGSEGDLTLIYDAVGGDRADWLFLSGQIDFAVSEQPLTEEQSGRVLHGTQAIPVTAGALAVIFNLPGVADLKLSREALSGIYLGEITRWNDARIAASNPHLALPALPVVPVHRSDASGATYAFTGFLSAVSRAWRDGPGQDRIVDWPTGTGSRGAAAMAAVVRNTIGAIGYSSVVTLHSSSTGQPSVALENQAGLFVLPSAAAAQKALSALDPEAGQPGGLRPANRDAYPIVIYLYANTRLRYATTEKAAALKRLLVYGLTEGQEASAQSGYVPLPDAVARRSLDLVEKIRRP